MTSQPSNQKGYAVILLLIAAGLAVAATVITYRVWVQSETENPTTSTAQPTPPPFKSPPPPNRIAPPPPDRVDLEAPSNLKVVGFGGGYRLTWTAPSIGSVSGYQVYQNNQKIADTTVTNYDHQLPPVPPGCKPIALTYFVKAVSAAGGSSDPSSSVTVQTAGC